jgi:predicted PurR-regulated permease PerM
VFGYVQAHGVEALERRMSTRRSACLVVFITLLLALLVLGFAIGPSLAEQAKDFPKQAQKHLATVDTELTALRKKSELLREYIPEMKVEHMLGEFFGIQTHVTAHLPPAPGPMPLANGGDRPIEERDDRWRQIRPVLVQFMVKTLASSTSILLSLLFSFLIILDLPNLTRGVQNLRNTKLRFFYEEVSETVFHFGQVLGKTLEAQLMIAVANTVLTAIGLWIMGLPSLAFLSAVVFVCSFIPVAGVFISSVPICLSALTTSGVGLMIVAILFIVFIHMVEAYVLNPRIMGAHLKVNPVLVLAILVICHHLFGMWGLILGLPVFTYFFGHAIQQHRFLTGAEATE